MREPNEVSPAPRTEIELLRHGIHEIAIAVTGSHQSDPSYGAVREIVDYARRILGHVMKEAPEVCGAVFVVAPRQVCSLPRGHKGPHNRVRECPTCGSGSPHQSCNEWGGITSPPTDCPNPFHAENTVWQSVHQVEPAPPTPKEENQNEEPSGYIPV